MTNTIEICRPGTPPTLQETVDIDEKTIFTQRLMNEHRIVADFISHTILNIQIGDYIIHKSENYYIEKVPNVTKINNSTFQYTIVFESIIAELNRKLFISSDGLADFSKNGTASDFIDDLITNINTISSGWTKGVVEATEYITMQFANESCRTVLDRIASTFKMEYEVIGKEISVKKLVGNTTAYRFEYGRNLGLYKLERQSVQDQNIVTRMYGFGGTTNLPNYYAARSKRLIFEDGGNRYLEKNVSLYGVREGQFTDDSIFPKFTGTLTAASIVFDGVDKLFNATLSYIEDSSLDFDLNDYLIAGMDANIVFKTGDMAGMQCVIWKYDDVNHRIYFNAVVDTVSGYATPRYNSGSPVQPEIGDTYTLVNIAQPISYVVAAETALQDATQAELDKRSVPQVVYSNEIDPKYSESISLDINVGDKVTIVDTDLGLDALIRVNSINYPLVNPYKITAIISDFVPYTRQEATTNIAISNVKNTSLVDKRRAEAEAINAQEIKKLRDSLFNADGTLRTDILGSSVDDAISVDSKTELIDGAILWKTGLTYSASDINYKILGTVFKTQKQEITLDAADATYARIDVFYVDMASNLHIAKGTPAANPVAPTLRWDQLYVTTATILAGATEPDELDVDWVYLENTEWTTSETHDEFVSVDFDSTDTPAAGTKRIKVAVSVPDTEISIPSHYIGEHYRGGIIFYIDPTDTRKGLIASNYLAKSSVFHERLSGGAPYSTGATGTAIGTGQANSVLLLANDRAKDQAVKYCNDWSVTENGVVYDDWFLGSINEYQKMFLAKKFLPNLGNTTLWSSSEIDWNHAWCMTTNNGQGYNRLKNNYYDVWPIRAFDDSTITAGIPVPQLTMQDTKMVFISATEEVVENGILSFNIKSSAEWLGNSILIIESLLNSVSTGVAVLKLPLNMNGYNSGDPSWQMVAMNLYKFAPNRTTLDGFRFTLASDWPNGIDLGLDDIRFQHSDVTTAQGLGYVPVKPINIDFIAQSFPTISDYNTKYASIYGQNPTVRLIIVDGSGIKSESIQKTLFTFDANGLLDTVYFDLGASTTGYIILSS
jgi:hypothetical protein